MKTFGFIQARISHNLKDPHSKALEPDCPFPSACDCDTVSLGEGKDEERFGYLKLEIGICLEFVIWDFKRYALCSLRFYGLDKI